MVELLTVAQCGNKQNSTNASFPSLSESEASSLATSANVASGQEENRLLLIDNSLLLAYDPSTKKYTSLTNEGVCGHLQLEKD